MQTNDNTPMRLLLDTLAKQVRDTKAAYYSNVPGVTYDDMAAAAERLLRMRAMAERMSGRKVTSAPTKKQIAVMLRGDFV